MDYRRAGLFRQHQQCRRRPVPPSRQQWLWLRSGHLCRARRDLCCSRRVCSELRCPSLCASLCASLCRSRCPLCSSRSKLLCSSFGLRQQRLQQRLQQLPPVALLPDAQDPLPQDPLLQGSQELLQLGLLDGLCPNVCRSGRLRTDLRCSSCLLPLSCADEVDDDDDDERVT